jgi:hypothetical protein
MAAWLEPFSSASAVIAATIICSRRATARCHGSVNWADRRRSGGEKERERSRGEERRGEERVRRLACG